MTTLSTAGWVVHDVGLATAIGGSLFGKAALEPALDEISSPKERDRVSADAWRRYSWVQLASHVAFAAPWFIGRSLRSGREVSARAGTLTRAKDIMMGVSLVTGVACHFLGRKLGKNIDRGEGPADGQKESRVLERVVATLGSINTLTNVGILGTTAVLAMEGTKSVKGAKSAKKLP
ncbi:MAG: hypothetical protein M4D80_19300 [Myxococcota bacterium]|nr:hypothetical protein [Deltaproteobacteria bacterium]MDQ3337314.1 hypothetical protein [Myxococcota bacterium]